VFHNRSISRKLNASGRIIVLDTLVAKGQAAWVSALFVCAYVYATCYRVLVDVSFRMIVDHLAGFFLSFCVSHLFLPIPATPNYLQLDKEKRKCAILWKRVEEWAEELINWARASGYESDVLTMDEIVTGGVAKGTELHGMDKDVLRMAVKELEKRGQARLFKSSTGDEGIKFG